MGEGPSDHIKKRFTSSFQIKRSLTSMLRGNKMTELVENGVKWTTLEPQLRSFLIKSA